MNFSLITLHPKQSGTSDYHQDYQISPGSRIINKLTSLGNTKTTEGSQNSPLFSTWNKLCAGLGGEKAMPKTMRQWTSPKTFVFVFLFYKGYSGFLFCYPNSMRHDYYTVMVINVFKIILLSLSLSYRHYHCNNSIIIFSVLLLLLFLFLLQL